METFHFCIFLPETYPVSDCTPSVSQGHRNRAMCKTKKAPICPQEVCILRGGDSYNKMPQWNQTGWWRGKYFSRKWQGQRSHLWETEIQWGKNGCGNGKGWERIQIDRPEWIWAWHIQVTSSLNLDVAGRRAERGASRKANWAKSCRTYGEVLEFHSKCHGILC